MDHNIKLRAQDAAGEVAQNPTQSPAGKRGQYEIALIEVVRTVARLAAERDGMPLEQLQAAPCSLDPTSPLVVAARQACIERGFQPDGALPRFGFGDRREEHAPGVDLDSIEQYRQQMAAIGVAAMGYWTEALGIHPDYDTVPLRDVAKLYAKYDALHRLQAAGQLPPGIGFAGYYDADENSGKTILEYVAALVKSDPDEVTPGTILKVEAAWTQPQEWRVVRTGQALEVERISPPVLELETVAAQAAKSVKELAKAMADDWILTGEQRPHDGQKVWITSVTEYSNAPPDYAVLESVFEFGNFRSPCGQMYSWPKHWKPRAKPLPPPLVGCGGTGQSGTGMPCHGCDACPK